MITYKSARNRPVLLGDLSIDYATGVTLDTADTVLDKLVEEGFLIVIKEKPPLKEVSVEQVQSVEPVKPSFKLFK